MEKQTFIKRTRQGRVFGENKQNQYLFLVFSSFFLNNLYCSLEVSFNIHVPGWFSLTHVLAFHGFPVSGVEGGAGADRGRTPRLN